MIELAKLASDLWCFCSTDPGGPCSECDGWYACGLVPVQQRSRQAASSKSERRVNISHVHALTIEVAVEAVSGGMCGGQTCPCQCPRTCRRSAFMFHPQQGTICRCTTAFDASSTSSAVQSTILCRAPNTLIWSAGACPQRQAAHLLCCADVMNKVLLAVHVIYFRCFEPFAI